MTHVPPAAGWIRTPFSIIDGGLSTALATLGHHADGPLWTAQLVIDRPEVIVEAHRLFVSAGVDIVITSSYQASVDGFVGAGLDAAGARIALAETTELARRSGAPFVAASIGPFGAALADGSEYHGHYAAGWDEVRAFHRSRIQVLADTSPDLFAIETMPSVVEAEIVVDELQRATSVPAWLSMTCRDGATTCAGDPIELLASLADRAPNIAAFGVNCTDPRLVASLLERAASVTALPLVAYPNHGRAWDGERKRWIGGDADPLIDHIADWVARGAQLVGGCCGVGPIELARVVAARSALGCDS